MFYRYVCKGYKSVLLKNQQIYWMCICIIL